MKVKKMIIKKEEVVNEKINLRALPLHIKKVLKKIFTQLTMGRFLPFCVLYHGC